MKPIPSFSPARWDTVRDRYVAWWHGRLSRPLLHVQIHGLDPGFPRPDGPFYGALSSYPLEYPMERILAQWHYQLCATRYLGDGYPTVLPDFGAGVNAAFCGARHEARPETVWFFADGAVDLETFHLVHHPDNPVWQRVCAFYREADAYFGGAVLLGMTHLNNGIDIPAHFFDGVELCMALYDQPEAVERLIWENHSLLLYYIDALSALMPHNPGYTCWGDIYAPEPWMGAQCDFCAMIGPEQFDRFVLPELRACFAHAPAYNFYHLDGREELIHLPKLLAIQQLQTVQWVPGVDTRPDREWHPLYREIRAAGKKLWYTGGEEDLERLADALGTLAGIYWRADGGPQDADRLCRLLERLGVPVE